MIYFYISILTYLCFCIIKYREGLYYLKKDNYDSSKFIKRIKSSGNIFLGSDIISLLLVIVCFNFNSKVIGICFTFVYMVLFLYKLKTKNFNIKSDKKIWYRVFFICLFYVILNIWFILDYISYHGKGFIYDNSALYYIVLIFAAYLSYFAIYIANVLSNLFKK